MPPDEIRLLHEALEAARRRQDAQKTESSASDPGFRICVIVADVAPSRSVFSRVHLKGESRPIVITALLGP